MRNFRPLLLMTLSLATGCALLARTYRPVHAPKSEAATVEFPWGEPEERVFLAGTWLRAVTLALDDYLPEEESARARAVSGLDECLHRRDNYYVTAWVWAPQQPSDAGDGGAPDFDGGSSPEPDAGDDHEVSQPGMPRAPPVIYVSISLLPGHCDLDGSPLMDVGATYAIDTVGWRILAIHH